MSRSKWPVIICLIISGELIFGLPFHVIRYFRPTLLEVFQFSNTQVGDAIAVYGVTALLSYFAGGVVADHFSARKLMAFSLVATAIGGIWMLSIPGQLGFSLLFGYWGVTTILLFWAAMLRATREWGGKNTQGRAFGFLDGGRGLVGAGAASFAVFYLVWFLPEDLSNVSPLERLHALRIVIWFYTISTLLAAVLVWYIIPETNYKKGEQNPFKGVREILKSRYVWLQAIIVVCAYSGYRGIDFYSLYGVEVLNMNEVDAAKLVTNGTYLRAVGAIGAGFLADRIGSGKTIKIIFVILFAAYVVLFASGSQETHSTFVIANLILTFLTVYALRGVYFALFEETNVPHHLTGTNVGLVSLVGYTPDIFFHSVAGRILDATPGKEGYQNFFLLLVIFSLLGLSATYLLTRKTVN